MKSSRTQINELNSINTDQVHLTRMADFRVGFKGLDRRVEILLLEILAVLGDFLLARGAVLILRICLVRPLVGEAGEV